MTKRQSTTAKITKKTAQLIEGYVTRTGNGVIVRHRGVEVGVTAENLGSIPPASECTTRKTTIATLQRWFDRYSAIFDLIASDRNGTAGIPSHRYIVSRKGGIETTDLTTLTPYVVSRFVDDTLDCETVGLWKSGEVYYLDSNTSFDRLPTAIEYGRSQEQIAIFDLATGGEVYC